MTSTISRRELLRLLAAGTASGLLAACQPEVVEKRVEVPVEQTVVVKETVEVEVEVEKEITPAPPEEVELRFAIYSWKPMQNWVEQIKTQYELANPHVTIVNEIAPYDAWLQKVTSQLAAGDAPDVFVSISDAAAKGQILELTDYMDADPTWSWDDFWPHNVQAVTVDPELALVGHGNRKFGVPFTGCLFLWVYNQDLFDAAGVDYPTADWDFDDLREAAQSLTLDENGNNAASPAFDADNIVQYGVSGLVNWKILGPIGWSYGHPYQESFFVDWVERKAGLDLPAAKEAFQYVYDLLHTYHVHPTPEVMEGLSDPFNTGKIAIQQGGSWNLPTWNEAEGFRVALMEQPMGPGGLRVYHGTGANQWSAYSGTKSPGQVADFMKYLGSVAAQELVIITKCGPPSRIKECEQFFNEELPNLEGADRLKDMFMEAVHAAGGPGYNELESYWNQETQLLWMGEASVDEVLEAMQKRVGEILATER